MTQTRRFGRFRSVRQWWWSRYALVAEVQTNEKALLETFSRMQVLDEMLAQYMESVDELIGDNGRLLARVEAQVLLLSALGQVEVSRAGHPSLFGGDDE